MIRGKITHILAPQSGVSKAGKQWMKQEFVLETEGQYPKKVAFTIFGEEKIKMAQLQQGHTVEIEVDAESREYNGKWYTDLNAWRVNNLSVGGTYQNPNNVYQQTPPTGYAPSGQQMQQPTYQQPSNDESLPF